MLRAGSTGALAAADPSGLLDAANTVSTTLLLHDAARKAREVKLTPYYTYVQDFIDVERIGTLSNGFVKLRFANHDAVLVGANLSAAARLYEDDRIGSFRLSGTVGCRLPIVSAPSRHGWPVIKSIRRRRA